MENNTHDEPARVQFGKRLRQYRQIYKLSQEKFAAAMGTKGAYISQVEDGEINIGIDNIEKYASFFGVKYYEMINPYHALPTGTREPSNIRDLKDELKKVKANLPKNPRIKLAPFLDELLATNYLKKPRTIAEIAAALKDKVVVPHNKITVLLTKHPRNKLIKVIPGEEWGGRVNKYVLI